MFKPLLRLALLVGCCAGFTVATAAPADQPPTLAKATNDVAPSSGATDAKNDADYPGNRRFQRLDTNHDGRISRQEAAKSPHLANHFDEVDTDHDGWISPDEKRMAWQARLAAQDKRKHAAKGTPTSHAADVVKKAVTPTPGNSMQP